MLAFLKRHSPRINRAVGDLANWAAIGGLLGGGALMTWAASSIAGLAAQGWGAVVFAGLGAACILILAGSVGLIGWRYFRPLSVADPRLKLNDPAHSGQLVTIEDHLKQLDRDALFLLHFSVDQTTIYLLEASIESLKINNDLSLEIDAEKRRKKMY